MQILVATLRGTVHQQLRAAAYAAPLPSKVVMVAAQRTRLDQQRRAVQRGKFQQFCSAVPRSVNEDETTSFH